MKPEPVPLVTMMSAASSPNTSSSNVIVNTMIEAFVGEASPLVTVTPGAVRSDVSVKTPSALPLPAASVAESAGTVTVTSPSPPGVTSIV